MPILVIGLVALAVFLSMFFMFLSAMLSEKRKRAESEPANSAELKSKAQATGQ